MSLLATLQIAATPGHSADEDETGRMSLIRVGSFENSKSCDK